MSDQPQRPSTNWFPASILSSSLQAAQMSLVPPTSASTTPTACEYQLKMHIKALSTIPNIESNQ